MDPGLRRGDGGVGSMDKHFFVYMMASKKNGTLYIGVTSDLVRRVYEHKEGLIEGFTQDYGCKDLVWYEAHDNAESAITKEKQMKDWQRDWKIRRIVEFNPEWRDLYSDICGVSNMDPGLRRDDEVKVSGNGVRV